MTDSDDACLRNFYPQEALDQGITEVVVRVRATIDETGRITRAQAQAHPGYTLDRAAERSAMNCISVEAARDRRGNPVGSQLTIAIRVQME
jgi:TonB family protein